MSRSTGVMVALDLLLDVAYHDGAPRDLAVAAEAYTLAGYHDAAILISHAGRHDDLMAVVASARRGRPRKLLRADARGMLATIRALIDAGVLDERACANATNQRWIARGGHDR
jgi:hypothetical protein